VLGFSLWIDADAGVVHLTAVHRGLHIADHSGPLPEGAMCGQHRRQPARLQHQVVVQKGQQPPLGHGGRAVVARGVSEVALIEHHAGIASSQARQPVTGSIRAAIVHEDELPADTGWPG
jgi:hypothetical protein